MNQALVNSRSRSSNLRIPKPKNLIKKLIQDSQKIPKKRGREKIEMHSNPRKIVFPSLNDLSKPEIEPIEEFRVIEE